MNSIILRKLEQLERLRSKNTLRRPMIIYTIDSNRIPFIQVKTRQLKPMLQI